jgi:hypothetical protein
MTARPDSDPRAPAPTSDDAAFLRRVADAYAPPPMTPSRRVRFDARLGERIAPARQPWLAWVAGATAAATAGLLVVATWTTSPPAQPEVAAAPARPSAVVLAELYDPAPADFDATLPADYQAIAGLLEL